ncbi:MAG: TRAP transporter small permease [Variovorax sp.]|nr:TRAP transporter small permease [Variovorax sp.]
MTYPHSTSAPLAEGALRETDVGGLGAALRGAARISRWLAWLGGALLLLCAILVSLDVVFRAVLKVTVFESFELSTYAFAIATALGMSYALASRAHIRIEVVYQTFPVHWRGWLDVFAYAALTLSAGVLLFWCGAMVLGNYDSGARSNSSLSVPLAVPQAVWLLGLAWFAALALLYALYGLRNCLRGRADLAHRRLGVAALEEEIDANVSRGESQP